MSVEAVQAPAGRSRRVIERRRRSRHSGMSLLAQGEPMLWITGGALVVCLAMIAGLLYLILTSGMKTFWPVAVTKVELRDGTTLMGEVTRRESYPLTRGMVATMPPEVAAAAENQLGVAASVTAKRRMLRTGNFDLTDTHFHWVSEFAVTQEDQPKWAIVVERFEWGRFYGLPAQFALRHPRTVSHDEEQLAAIRQFLVAGPLRVSGRPGDVAAEIQTIEQKMLPQVEQQLQALRRQALDRFLQEMAVEPGVAYQAVTDSGQSMSLDEARSDEQAAANVVELQRAWIEPDQIWQQFQSHHNDVLDRYEQRRRLEEFEIGRVDARIEAARLDLRQEELDRDLFVVALANEARVLEDTLQAMQREKDDARAVLASIRKRFGDHPEFVQAAGKLAEALLAAIDQDAEQPKQRLDTVRGQLADLPAPTRDLVDRFFKVYQDAQNEKEAIERRIRELNNENLRLEMKLVTVQGVEKALRLDEIVRAYPANQLSLGQKLSVYMARWSEFLAEAPREANEGGVFPAIWGTVAMTLIMSVLVVPFGVLAALYLREYARGGWIVSSIRIAINNLAGVPSIVFGVFGLGFFCYFVGAYVDGGPTNAGIRPWPPVRWFVTLGLLSMTAVAAFFTSLFSTTSTGQTRSRSKIIAGRLATVLWLSATAVAVALIATCPYFNGFHQAKLPDSTYGSGGLLWAACTLALLTLPVVIVATEEALSAVPNSLREGSYAAGASKWQTIRRIVLPHAMPGIMTGMILAMARGAGEVAPLMLVGAAKVAAKLPVDGQFPFVHPDRRFMHLGFHIFDLGFQSQNSEAAKPMVFTSTLLLITIVAALNLTAVMLRNRLRRRFQASHF